MRFFIPLKTWLQLCIPGFLAGLLFACGPHLAPTTPPQSNPGPPATQASQVSTGPVALKEMAAVNRLIRETLTPNGPGVAVLVLKNNQVIHASGQGFANVATKQPITPETNFDLASVSKQITAIATLKLVQAGDLALDTPIAQYLPDFRQRTVTIRHLLHHTSGLADYSSDDWDGSDAEFAQLDLEQHFRWLNQQKTHRPPGQQFEYNNSGYALLALLVQTVSQKPFWQFAQDTIFTPLAMSRTQILHQTGQKIPQVALGYRVNQRGQIKRSESPSIIQGDGNVFSSLVDLAKYDIAWRNQQLVPQALFEEGFKPVVLTEPAAAPETEGDGQAENERYGFGWFVTDRYLHHTGSWYGTSTYYRHYFADHTIIVLSNDESYDCTALADQIADALNF